MSESGSAQTAVTITLHLHSCVLYYQLPLNLLDFSLCIILGFPIAVCEYQCTPVFPPYHPILHPSHFSLQVLSATAAIWGDIF